MGRKAVFLCSASLAFALIAARIAWSDTLDPVSGVELQPLQAQVRRVAETLDFIGSPLQPEEKDALKRAFELAGDEGAHAIQRVLEPRVLVAVSINPESRVKAKRGPAAADLVQQGWTVFLVRVHNEAGVTAPLRVASRNAAPLHVRSSGKAEPPVGVPPAEVGSRWLDVGMFDSPPLDKALSGLGLEYRVIELYSRDVGKREANLDFNVGQGTQDLGFRSEVNILFQCVPAVEVVLDVLDWDGAPVTASFLIRDLRGRVHPSPSRRLAPDLFFHPQIYRAHGESVFLPPGRFRVEWTRGPEYLDETRDIDVASDVKTQRETFRLRRWVHPKALGWYSGDHHIHAAGCAHYESPAEGVTPQDMMRHILGEDLNVGCVLSWGPCWYFQKQYFEGKVSELSRKDNLMRYDVEVSGFPSQHAGHLCLLRLKEDDYPGTQRIEEWPSWDLPILRWGKEQGGVVGFSHSGWGLEVATSEIPNYLIPPYDGIGANEYIVDVVHGVVDFISSVDTPVASELNIWYHTLNCGFSARLSGETDFPCIYGERVGLGRVYAKLEGGLDFDRFCEELRNGRTYVGDGRSHLFDFAVDGLEVGTKGSQIALAQPQEVTVTARVAAYLNPERQPRIRDLPLNQKPYWHVERARIGETREVAVELVVNAYPVARSQVVADGTIREVSFRVPVAKSSWLALRVLPSSHTNPIFVSVGGKPIRASRRSAQWCLDGVDKCWSQKERGIRRTEQEAAKAAYEVARQTYRKILDECVE